MCTHNVEHEADESMMRCKRQEHAIDQHDVLEVVDYALAVQEVHRRAQKVPIQCLREAQRTRSTGHIGDSYHLLEADDLYRRYDDDHVNMAGEHAAEEDGNHDQSPDGAGDEGLSLLFGFGGLLFLCLLLLVAFTLVVRIPTTRAVCVLSFDTWTLDAAVTGRAPRAIALEVFSVGRSLAAMAWPVVVEFDVALHLEYLLRDTTGVPSLLFLFGLGGT